MGGGIGSSFPRLVSSIKAFARIDMIKSPPSGISRELVGTQAVGLAMCGDGSKQIEKVPDDVDTGVGFNGDGDESGKRISSEFGICAGQSTGLAAAEVPYLSRQP